MELPFVITKPFSNNSELSKKFAGLLPVKHTISFLKFEKGGSTQRLLHALKYGKRPEVGLLLGELMAVELRDAGLKPDFDYILPIPLHTKKLITRGYNQAMALAEGIANGFKTEASDSILIRTTATDSQTKKGKLQRILNVGEVFGIHPENRHLLKGKHILMVDDVVTTGSTMEACAKLLIQEPIGSLSIATIAMA
jgi:ComF family protein